MLMVLSRSDEQESALRKLLDDQQNKASSSYRQWLTPEQFGQQFGTSDDDVHAVVTWLQSHGFQVSAPSKGRTVIEFSGSASQVQTAFQTSIHKYEVNGEQHWANSQPPSIPSALAPVVRGVVSLHSFPRKSYASVQGTPVRSAVGHSGALPMFTFTPKSTTYYGVGPTDFATIYNVLPLWNAGIDGTGQTIAIVGESNIRLTDVENFRSLFGLPAKDPQVIVNGIDPGIVGGDETEALLDVSWSGAVAKNATIDYVVSASTESTLGVDLSALYIVDNNLAPVMSESYGECERVLGNAGNAFYNSLWQQAAAQGITVMVSAGDGGSAGCDNFDTELVASDGVAVSGFASTPYNVAVGGTDFDQTATTAPNYWNSTNTTKTEASAKAYIPETVWNASCAGLGTDQCTDNSTLLNIVAGSGGPSSCSTQDSSTGCLSGYAKPSWQTGTSVPVDGVRDLPDVSLFASSGANSSFYIICEADAGFLGSSETCSLTDYTFVGVGGTSASSPAFAGIMALVNQSMAAKGSSARQGNANYLLYKLAAQSGASCNSSTVALTGNSCVFYDITKGNNSVPCYPGTTDCGTAAANSYGVMVDPNSSSAAAWLAGTGYDMASGLGSVNAYNLVNQWSSASFNPTTTTLSGVTPTSITHGQAVSISATVVPQSGSGTPSGSIALMAAPSGSSVGVGNLTLSNGAASGTTTLLPGGTYNVTAHYEGDSTFGASDSAPVQVTVAKENSQTKATLEAYDPTSYSFYQTTSIPYGTVFFLRGDVTNASGTSCSPNPQQSQVACPSGTLSFTNNGKTLDAGTYALNTQGYTEDQSAATDFTSLGSYPLEAAYSGDNSYNTSTATLNATVTQATTVMEDFEAYVGFGTTSATVYSGQPFEVIASVMARSVLQAPSGSISILQNGAAPPGTITQTPRNGSFTGGYSSGSFGWAFLTAYLNESIDTPGTYNFTASYPGDTFYSGTQNSWAVSVTVLDTTFKIVTPIQSVTIASAGQSGTATVNLVGVDNFYGSVTVSCALPATMTEATCQSATATLSGSAAVPLAITTTAPHTLSASRHSRLLPFSAGIMAGVVTLFVGRFRRVRPFLALLAVAFVMFLMSCGGGGGTSSKPVTDPGTPAGTYPVTVTATSLGITRTATFNVIVQ
jgi:hypothetical protein